MEIEDVKSYIEDNLKISISVDDDYHANHKALVVELLLDGRRIDHDRIYEDEIRELISAK